MYANYENSSAGGYPVELFEFVVDGVTYRYAHHDDDVQLLDSSVWTSAMVQRSAFSKGSEVEQASVTLTTNETLPLLEVFVDGIPESRIEVTVSRVHLTDPDLEPWIIWVGEVTSLKRMSRKIQLKCDPPESLLRSVGLRRRYQSSCPYPLYGNGCFVVRADFSVPATVISISGTTIKLSLANCGPYVGGMLVSSLVSPEKYRLVVSGVGDTIIVTRPVSWLSVQDTVMMARGCDKTFGTCRGVFRNLDNYGGMPHIPTTNIFNTKVF